MSKVTSITTLSPYNKEDKCAFIEITEPKQYFLLQPIEFTDQYTISFFIKAESEETLSLWYGESTKEFVVNTHWTRVVWSFKAEYVDNLMLHFTQGNYYMYNTKLERGSVATDYTQSLDDGQKEITDIETESLIRYNEVIQSLDSYKVEVGKTYSTKNEVQEVKTLSEQTADTIKLMVESNEQQTEFVLTDKMIKAITTQFVVTNEDGTSTIIDGGTINLEQLFAQDITATGTIRGVKLITNNGTIGGFKLHDGYLEGANEQISDYVVILNANPEASEYAILVGTYDYGTETEPYIAYAPIKLGFNGLCELDNLKANGGTIGKFVIDNGALKADTYAEDGYVRRVFVQPASRTNPDDTWIMSIQKATTQGTNPSAYSGVFYLTGDGDVRANTVKTALGADLDELYAKIATLEAQIASLQS